MNPLAAFQVLALAMAAAMAVEAFKPTYPKEWRIAFWVVFGILAIAGVATNQVAAAWPAASSFMAWAVSSPVTIFLAFIAWVIMLQRPWRRSPGSSYDDTALRADIVEASNLANLLHMGGMETHKKTEQVEGKLDLTIELFGERLEKLEKGAADAKRAAEASHERINSVVAAMDRVRDYAEGTNHNVSTAQVEAEQAQKLFIQRMETWVGNLRREIRLGFKGVDRGFAAIYARERLLDMAYDLTKVGDKLTAPSRGEPLGDWAEWEAKAGPWHKAVEAWARLAEEWREGTIERVILNTPPSEYKQDWGVEDYNIFPNHNAGHDYKTLCITSRNFHVERKSVDQYMLSAAFVRPSKKPVLSLAELKELDDENPPALPPPEVQDD
ncbi:MAG TPA: hypothetical protein VF650_08420 [Allosphingosinicella sp.]|jgi:hypothetical protein